MASHIDSALTSCGVVQHIEFCCPSGDNNSIRWLLPLDRLAFYKREDYSAFYGWGEVRNWIPDSSLIEYMSWNVALVMRLCWLFSHPQVTTCWRRGHLDKLRNHELKTMGRGRLWWRQKSLCLGQKWRNKVKGNGIELARSPREARDQLHRGTHVQLGQRGHFW